MKRDDAAHVATPDPGRERDGNRDLRSPRPPAVFVRLLSAFGGDPAGKVIRLPAVLADALVEKGIGVEVAIGPGVTVPKDRGKKPIPPAGPLETGPRRKPLGETE